VPPSAIGKNIIFWRKIVIFHTKYPKHFRASLRSAQFFKYVTVQHRNQHINYMIVHLEQNNRHLYSQ
jgi:hypothetical protein